MLKELIKMAGEFDRLGLRKEADQVDAIIRKASETDGWSDEGTMEYLGEDTNPEDSEKDLPDTLQKLMVAQESLRNICSQMSQMSQEESVRMHSEDEPISESYEDYIDVPLSQYYEKMCKLVMLHANRIDELQALYSKEMQ